MNKLDYKKEYKDLYLPKTKPMLIEVPVINYVCVDGHGNPNNSEAYQEAMSLLYGISFTIKMSKMTSNQLPGYFEYVVPPLEGLWWWDAKHLDLMMVDKDKFNWKSMIRLPEFVSLAVFNQAKAILKAKKPGLDLDKAHFETINEGLCVQIMHRGSYDEEALSIQKMITFIDNNDLVVDINEIRRHHEIYLSDPRRTKVENLKTVIRYPVKRR